ncbi:MAG TPA: glycerophosphodiester phosphodiesterase family protein [Anaerolineales bacterium]|nr:glycerophosphodiester phosphodiesterase family protein [Anaerolineales bacterium]
MSGDPIVRVAHRGASAQYPENTLLAFRRALEAGVDALELDIQCTADDELVVIHDATLDRTTNGQGRVSAQRLQEIRRLDAGQGEKVPLLAEVIELARAGHARLCVEIKGAAEPEELALAEAVIRLLESMDFLSQAIVTSFSSAALLHAKAIHPEAATMLDPSPQDGSLTPRQICAQTLRAGANCLSYDFRFLTPGIVRECQLTGLALWPWDPDRPEDLRQVISLGVPGIMTNRPDLLNKVLHDAPL